MPERRLALPATTTVAAAADNDNADDNNQNNDDDDDANENDANKAEEEEEEVDDEVEVRYQGVLFEQLPARLSSRGRQMLGGDYYLGLPFRNEGGLNPAFFDFSTQVENASGINGPEGIDSEVK